MKILVIRLKQIGDALISLPVCESLRRTYPHAQIHYLVYEHIAPLFENHPAIDKVITFTQSDRKYKLGYFQKMMSLRRERYDIAIDLITVPISAITAYISGAPVTIGFDKGKLRSRLYSTRVKHMPELGARDSKLAILGGLSDDVALDRTMRVCLRAEEQLKMQTCMRQAGIDTDRPVFMFSPISRLGLKNWPAEYFVTLIQKTLNTVDGQAVLIWGPGERETVHAIAQKAGMQDRVFVNIETPGLRDLAALAANCALFIGNDSGPRHVAEAVGIRTFTIFAPEVRKTVWLPNESVRHRAVDMTDLLQIDNEQWFARRDEFAQQSAKYYSSMTPEFVFEHLRSTLTTIAQGK